MRKYQIKFEFQFSISSITFVPLFTAAYNVSLDAVGSPEKAPFRCTSKRVYSKFWFNLKTERLNFNLLSKFLLLGWLSMFHKLLFLNDIISYPLLTFNRFWRQV